MSKLYLGVEIGGTKQQIIVGNEKGEIVDMISERFPLKNGAIDVLDWMERKVPILLNKYTIERIGIGFGGAVMGCPDHLAKTLGEGAREILKDIAYNPDGTPVICCFLLYNSSNFVKLSTSTSFNGV